MNVEDILTGESKNVEFKRERPMDAKKYVKSVNLYRKNAIGTAVAPIVQSKRTDGEIIPIVKGTQTDGQTNGQTNGKMNGKTTDTEDKILQIICEDASVTQDEIAERIGISNSGVRYAMRKMKSRGILKRVGSHKNGKWQIIPFQKEE